ncbi:hypothetical protein Esti_001134 [Eimeria stiedai]
MTESQVPSLPSQQRLQKQLLQHLRRDLNRLSDSNRSTRIHGAQAILNVFRTEATRGAARSGEDVTTSSSVSAAGGRSGSCQPAYSEVFLESLYGPVCALCADAASETCRAIALELLQLVLNEFLSREDVIALCSGIRRSCNTITSRETGCPLSYVSAPFCCERPGGDFGCKSSGSGNTNSAPMKPLVAVLAERLRANPPTEETSEELRALVLHLLQQLVQQYAASPHSVCKDEASQEEKQLLQGWDTKALADPLLAGVAGALRDRSPSNAIEACSLLSIVSARLEPSLLLQSSKNLLEKLAACLTRPQRAVRLKAIEAYEALLTALSSPAATEGSPAAAVSAANHITTAAQAMRHLLQQESAMHNKLRVVQLVRRLLQEMSPRTLLRPKVQPQLLLLLFFLLGDADPKVGGEAKQTLLSIAARSVMYYRKSRAKVELRKEHRKMREREGEDDSSTSSDASSSGEESLKEEELNKKDGALAQAKGEKQSLEEPHVLLTELAGIHMDALMGDLLPRLTSWSADERLASLRTVAALLTICGPHLLGQLSTLLLQLYGFCSAAGGGSVEPKQQQQFHQGSPMLLLVQHAVLRELRGEEVLAGSASSDPWHCEGLQELGACSALCCSLQALEVSVHCAGLIAKLLPPCAWLPLVAAHLGLQREAVLYANSKEAALAAAFGNAADSDIDAEAASFPTAELKFLEQFSGGYKSVVETIGLSGTATRRPRKKDEPLTSKLFTGKRRHVCSVEAKQHALLLLARMLRSVKLPVEQHEQQLQGDHQVISVAAGFRGEYELGEEEIYLLVQIIEQMQAGGNTNFSASAPAASVTAAAAVAQDNGELLPYVAAPLLQLLHAGGSLCKLEAKRLFAAALVQRVDSRSHPEIATAAVRQVCGCTGTSSLLLYLSFIGDFVASELGGAFKNEDDGEVAEAANDRATAALAAEHDSYQEAVWSSNDTRRLLLLHALHGAQEAAGALHERPDAIECPWLPGLFQVLESQGTSPAAAPAVRADVLGACLALFSLPLFIPLAQPYGRWVLEHILAPNLRWRPGEANAKIRKVSLLCVSQIIPTLSNDKSSGCHTPSTQVNEADEQPFEDAQAAQETSGFSRERKDAEHLSTQAAPVEIDRGGEVAASIALLSPLLVCCIDDEWNVDVRALAVGVVRELFLDLRGCLGQHEALEQLATATAGPLQQRLDDARDDIRVAAAAALEALLLQRPQLLRRPIATDVYKQLCLCLDDRNERLASAAAAALLAGADVHRAVLLEELHGAESRCLFPERYKQLLEKAQRVRQSSDAEVVDAAPQQHENTATRAEDKSVKPREGNTERDLRET